MPIPNTSETPIGMSQAPAQQEDQALESLIPESGEEQDPQRPVTQAEVQKLFTQKFAELQKNLTEQQRRGVQSSTMAAESRIQKQIESGLNNLKSTLEKLTAQGVQVPPEKIQAMKNGIIEEAFTSVENPSKNRQQTAGQNQQQGGDQDPNETATKYLVAQIAQSVYQEVGVAIYPDDPEAAGVDMSNPVRFTKTLTAAAEKKKARLSTDPSLRVASNGSSSGGSNATLLSQYQKEVAAIPRGPTYAKTMVEINMKYRNKGLKDI